MRLIRLLLVLIALPITSSAQVPPAPIPGGSIGDWFASLRSPQGVKCCDVSDCRRVSVRLTTTGYQALIETGWVNVPDHVIVRRGDNPIGEAVLCYELFNQGTPVERLSIYCFFPGMEG